MASEAIRRARRLKQLSEDAQSEGHWQRAERLRERQWQAQQQAKRTDR